MKKFLSFTTVAVLLTVFANAQGVSKLFGLVGGSPQANQSSNGFLFSTDSSGNNLQVRYDFPVTVFGAMPANLEMMPWNGKLYGTTTRGGTNDFGTIFEYDPATNIYTKKFDFGPANLTGGSPKGSLLLYNNKFYGLAADYAVNGAGCLFEWDPATNVFTKKFDFNGNGIYPGSNPQNSLRLLNGKMYGTTQQGGASNVGVVFEWDPVANTSTKIFELNGTNGWGFYGNVTIYNNRLYCMSNSGAANNYGALYVIDPALPVGSNTTTIKVFDQTSGGTGNNGELIVYNNKLYGTTLQAGADFSGTLFEVDPATNVFTKRADFVYGTSGRHPQGKMVLNGTKFLGLCSNGGTNGTGTVFEWDPANPTVLVNKASFGPSNFDAPINPGSTLAFFNNKFYGVCYNGGFVNQGTLFEFDPAGNTIAKKLTFNAAENGRIPHGKPVLLNGKIYGTCYQGPQEIFGTPYGCLWSFDPSTSTYARRLLFDQPNNAVKGRAPISSPVAYNGKLYGTTGNGGTADYGVLYEFDPLTDAYTKKDIQPIGGAFPIGEPTLYNNKFYGMTNANGLGNNGIIYSYDPATTVLAKLYDVQSSGSHVPRGGFAVYNNKLYGTTSGGGANNLGAIIAYDPATNTASSVYSFAGGTGYNAGNAMTLYNNQFYGTALSGGSSGRGVIFRFDPATNIYTVIHHFGTTPGGTGLDPKGELTVSGGKLYCISQEGNTIVKVLELDPVNNTVTVRSNHTTTNGNMPVTHNGLTVVPAFIANGIANGCETYPVVNINAGNNNQWVPILNNAGDVVAEIKANGNSLGNVTSSVYINNGPVREFAYMKQLYLDRNISISVQNPPATAVDIRLYIKTSEYLALRDGLNSLGQPSGISSISDIAILKNDEDCPAALNNNPVRLPTVSSNYEYGYVLAASVSSFSTFFFGKNTFSVLPISLLNFDAVKKDKQVALSWTTSAEVNVAHFEVERSTPNNNFTKIGTVNARGGNSNTAYTMNDNQPFSGINYYRLKPIDKDGKFSYSSIVKVDMTKTYSISISPNPASDHITISGMGSFTRIELIDMTGRTVKQMAKNNSNRYDLSGLSKGIYWLRLSDGSESHTQKIMID
jgi:uncharacterized repeat protein (TIGR03803 family)